MQAQPGRGLGRHGMLVTYRAIDGGVDAVACVAGVAPQRRDRGLLHCGPGRGPRSWAGEAAPLPASLC